MLFCFLSPQSFNTVFFHIRNDFCVAVSCIKFIFLAIFFIICNKQKSAHFRVRILVRKTGLEPDYNSSNPLIFKPFEVLCQLSCQLLKLISFNIYSSFIKSKIEQFNTFASFFISNNLKFNGLDRREYIVGNVKFIFLAN